LHVSIISFAASSRIQYTWFVRLRNKLLVFLQLPAGIISTKEGLKMNKKSGVRNKSLIEVQSTIYNHRQDRIELIESQKKRSKEAEKI
jgi:hypothetical protein